MCNVGTLYFLVPPFDNTCVYIYLYMRVSNLPTIHIHTHTLHTYLTISASHNLHGFKWIPEELNRNPQKATANVFQIILNLFILTRTSYFYVSLSRSLSLYLNVSVYHFTNMYMLITLNIHTYTRNVYSSMKKSSRSNERLFNLLKFKRCVTIDNTHLDLFVENIFVKHFKYK